MRKQATSGEVRGARFNHFRFFVFFDARRSTLDAGQKGFTLLLAAIVAAIVLAIGAAIFSIALKQVALSATGRDSQFAFYAADSSAECALFWDSRFDIQPYTFATSSSPHTPVQISCAQVQVTPVVAAADTSSATSTFQYDILAGSEKYCAFVTVAKSLDQNTGAVATVIRGDGYSVSCAATSTDSDALQRSVVLRY